MLKTYLLISDAHLKGEPPPAINVVPFPITRTLRAAERAYDAEQARVDRPRARGQGRRVQQSHPALALRGARQGHSLSALAQKEMMPARLEISAGQPPRTPIPQRPRNRRDANRSFAASLQPGSPVPQQ